MHELYQRENNVATNTGVARIFPTGWGGGGGANEVFFFSSHGREILENSCMKTAFSCTLNAIIRG